MRLGVAGREKTGTNRPHRRLDGGRLPTCDVADCYEINGKPHKELVKIAHPPINCRRNPL